VITHTLLASKTLDELWDRHQCFYMQQHAQDMQCTYYVTVRRIQWKSDKCYIYLFVCVCVCVCLCVWGGGGCTDTCLRACSLNYSARNTPPYCHCAASLAPPRFSTSPHKRFGFLKELLDIKSVLIFFKTFI
jgi:hypothetical protein